MPRSASPTRWSLKPAFAMAAAFAVVLAVAAVADASFGASASSRPAAIAGTNDVHAATLAAATLSAAGSIAPREALLAILVAFVVNMIVKVTIVGMSPAVGVCSRCVAPPLAAMTAAAVAAYVATLGRSLLAKLLGYRFDRKGECFRSSRAAATG